LRLAAESYGFRDCALTETPDSYAESLADFIACAEVREACGT
jgi:hypothetical protein